jgi:hypothetical protein
MTPERRKLFLSLSGSLDPIVRDYVTDVEAGGKSVSSSTIHILNSAIVKLRVAGILSKIYMFDACIGVDMDASLYRIITPVGVDRKAVTGGFADEDYNERGASGGRTGNGTSKSIDTLINPSALGFSTSSFMMWAYTRAAAVGATSRITAGAQDTSSRLLLLGWAAAGTRETVGLAATSTPEYATGSASSLTGLLGGGTNGSRVTQFYQNGVAIGATGTGSDVFSNRNIYAHASNVNGSPGVYSNRTISSMIFCQGLSSDDRATLNTIVQAFETALGRNV